MIVSHLKGLCLLGGFIKFAQYKPTVSNVEDIDCTRSKHYDERGGPAVLRLL